METIFASATAPLKSGVAIIRVSGAAAGECIALLTKNKDLKPRQARLQKIYNPDGGELIDEALVLWFPAPASFTGEDIAEFHVHGSRAVIEEMLEVLSLVPNARLAEAGEFSRRAFENNKMDLTEAEGLADLIDAETKIQARQALRQKSGILKDLYDKWRKDLIALLANIEAYIDFPDEEIPDNVLAQVENQVVSLKSSIELHLNDNKRGEKLRNGLYAVIAGSPNVGKSSLMNCLAKRDVAIVSDIAGTTRDVIEVHLDLSGYPVVLADTAGLRENAEVIEMEGIKRAHARIEESDIKIVMFSADELAKIDKASVDIIGDDTIVVINKADLIDKVETPQALDATCPIIISVETQVGIAEFIKKLEELARKHLEITPDPVITRERHRNLLNQTVLCLSRFDLNDELELSSENLRQSAVSLGKITGHIDVEEILDDIFSNFCIGK